MAKSVPASPRSASKGLLSPPFDANDPAERRRRASREERFLDGDAGFEEASPQLRLVGLGTSTALEKPYLRLTAPPAAHTVRPPHVLLQSLARVKKRWREAPADAAPYAWACEQLRSIRQDLTVQRVRDELAVDVYETHARLALEARDDDQLLQTLSVLRALHLAVSGAGCPPEFAAYRLLHAARSGRDAFSAELRALRRFERRHAYVVHALAVADAVRSGNACSFFRLYASAPRMSAYLMDSLSPVMRACSLAASLAAYRPGVPAEWLGQLCGFAADEQPQFLQWALASGAAELQELPADASGAWLCAPRAAAPSSEGKVGKQSATAAASPSLPAKRKKKKHRREHAALST